MKVTFSTRQVSLVFLLGVLVLSCVSIAGYILGKLLKGTAGAEVLGPLLHSFTVANNDTSVGTWVSSFALLFSSVLLGLIAIAKRRLGDRYGLHWAGLSVIFLLLSIDEVATIHEALGDAGAEVAISMGFTPKGFVSYFWVVPGFIFVLTVLLAYLRFLSHLPKKYSLLFLGAGAIYVGGALGVETLESQMAYLRDARGSDLKQVLDVIRVIWIGEEILELLGIVVFIYALLSYIGSYLNEITIQINNDSSPS
jgi:hypothetical protein